MRARNRDLLRGLLLVGVLSALLSLIFLLLCTQVFRSATMDFLLEGGVGYQFQNDWHVTLQVSHVSNGGLSDDTNYKPH